MNAEQGWFRRLITENPYSFVYFCESLAVWFMFVSGVGRFRVVVVYAVYLLINSFLSIGRIDKRVPYLLLPFSVVAIYFDVEYGQLFPVFTENHVIIAIISMAIIDNIAKRYALSVVDSLACSQIFKICPKCKFENSEFVSKCMHCSYELNKDCRRTSVCKISNDKIPLKVLHMIDLNEDEYISFFIRLFPFRSVIKNGIREIRTFLIITSEKIIFLDYLLFRESLREKDVINLKDVVSMSLKMKKIYLAEEPFFEIVTSNNDVYEIIFKKIGKYEEYCAKIKNAITINVED